MLVICNGMKRSGSTLQYNWVVSLLEITGKSEIIKEIEDKFSDYLKQNNYIK
jgi:hypothetical protein